MKKEIIAIIAGILLVSVSAALPAVAIFLLLFEESSEKFTVPGSIELNAGKDGKYYLWYNNKTLFKNRTYTTGKEIPGGLVIALHGIDGGGNYEIVPSSSSFSSGSEERTCVGYFELKKGRYLLKVDGTEDERVFSFGPSREFTWLTLLGVGFILSMFLVPLGAMVVVIAFILLVIKLVRNVRPAGRLDMFFKAIFYHRSEEGATCR